MTQYLSILATLLLLATAACTDNSLQALKRPSFAGLGDQEAAVSFEKNLSSDGKVTVRWSYAEGDTSYKVQICASFGCKSDCTEEETVGKPYATLSVADTLKAYACVVPYQGEVASPKLFSAPDSITVDTTPPELSVIATRTKPLEHNVKAIASDLTAVTYVWDIVAGEKSDVTLSLVSPSSALVTGSKDGIYILRVTATDAAGHVTTLDKELVMDSVGPQISFAQPTLVSVVSLSNQTNFPLSGSCDVDGSLVNVEVSDGTLLAKPTMAPLCQLSQSPNWSGLVNLAGLTGPSLTFKASVSDEAGNVTTAMVDAVLNATGNMSSPILSITKQPDAIMRGGETQTLGFHVTSAVGLQTLTWAYAADGVNYGAETSLDTGALSLDYLSPDAVASAVGATLRVTATDINLRSTAIVSLPFQIVTEFVELTSPLRRATGNADGSGNDARFSNLFSITTDGIYLYVSDSHSIRRVSYVDGSTQTLAGLTSMSGSDDGIGNLARFSSPRGLTALNGFLYIVDAGNHTIRKLDINPASPSYRSVSTLAGVAGSTGSVNDVGALARFNNPYAITNDGQYLYVTDNNNHMIRRVDPVSGAVSTFVGAAGQGFVDGLANVAKLSSPRAIVYDGSGALYVSEAGSVDIRKVTLTTPTVSSVAGTSRVQGMMDGSITTGTFYSPLGLAFEGGPSLYVLDQSIHAIRKVNVTTGALSTVYGTKAFQGYQNGASALFSQPTDIVRVGTLLFVTDTWNHVIRKIDLSTGITSRLAGAPYGSPGFDPRLSASGTSSAHFDTINNLTTTDGNEFYFAQPYLATIRKLNLSGNMSSTIVGQTGISAVVDGPAGVARFGKPRFVLKLGTDLYVLDGNAIRKVDLSDNSVTTVAGDYVASGTTNGTGTAARFSSAQSMVGDTTNLYIMDTNNHRIRVMNRSTLAVTTLAGNGSGYAEGTGTAALFKGPNYAALVGNQLYVADAGNFCVRQIDVTTGLTSTYAGSCTVSGNTDGSLANMRFVATGGIAIDGGKIYVSDNNTLRILDMTTLTSTTTIRGSISGITTDAITPRSSAFISTGPLTAFAGKIYARSSSGVTNVVIEYDPVARYMRPIAGHSNGSINNFKMGLSSQDGTLNDIVPNRYGEYVGSDGQYLYVADPYNYVIRRFNLDGSSHTVIAGIEGVPGNVDGSLGSGKLGFMRSPVIDSNYLYFFDLSANTVRRINLSNNVMDTIAGTNGNYGHVDGVGAAASFIYVSSLAVHREALYISERGTHTVRRLSLKASDYGTVTTIAGKNGILSYLDGPNGTSLFSGVNALVVMQDKLYVLETNNRNVRVIDLNDPLYTTSTLLTSLPATCTDGNRSFPDDKICFGSLLGSDGRETLFISDPTNVIKKYNVRTGAVSVFAGVKFNATDAGPGPLSQTPLATGQLTYVEGQGLFFNSGFSLLLLK